MREPPANLPHDALRAGLQAGYGLSVAELLFLPLGHDASAWVYRVATDDGAAYFLKVRRSVTNESSLVVPHYLREHGVTQVVAPLASLAGTLWTALADYALILYPFIAGVAGMEHGLSDQQWIDYGAILRQIHATVVTPDLARRMKREGFAPASAGTVREVDAHIAEQTFDDSISRELGSVWRARRAQIRALLERAENLGQRLAQTALPFVLCHADIHTNNVLLDTKQQVWIVDWDETVLAPKERDLMFVAGGISAKLVGPREEELFFRGYGPTAIDPLALAYYRYAWAVNDIGEYAAQVFFRPDLGAETRRAGVEGFMSLFRPGEIVAIALGSDDGGA